LHEETTMSAHRPAAAILAVALTLMLAPAAVEARKSPSPMVDKINATREAHGLAPMRYSTTLSRSSSRFARYLARTQQFRHGSRISASSRFSVLGEILALMRGWEIRRSLTLAYWLRSWSHRMVVLNGTYRYVGAARVRGYYAGSPMMFWTVQFGR